MDGIQRINACFQQLAQSRRSGLIPFLMAGDPDAQTSLQLLQTAAEHADILEIGMPFSDPMADGPVIQRAGERALAGGTTLSGVLELVRQLRRSHSLPVVLMGYTNPVYAYGWQPFLEDARAAGVDGLLLVDLPPEEAAGFDPAAENYGIALIRLLAPNTDRERRAQLVAAAQGFLYCVSLTGVTGAGGLALEGLATRLQEIRQQTQLPLAVGFGVSTPQQAREVAQVADAVVVGSALVRCIEEGMATGDGQARLQFKLQELAAALGTEKQLAT